MDSDYSTRELTVWTSEFGRAYTDRNPIDVDAMDRELGEWCGCGKKSDLFRQFLPPARIPSGSVLEVGCNVGVQLKILQTVNPGLTLTGLEPMKYAREKGQAYHSDITFVEGTAFNIPCDDNSFDVVMTNTVLIHIHPSDLPRALAEIHRVARRYIHFHEYYADTVTPVSYQGESGLMWKTNFMQRYLESFDDLHEVDVRYLHYKDVKDGRSLIDQVALLEKESSSLPSPRREHE